jgi:hypothetical protein
MIPWRCLVFGVYMADNPCCIQFMFIFQISLISFHLQRLSRFMSTSNLKISSKNNNQYISRESHWYLHSWTWLIEDDKQCTIAINSNGCTVYKHHVLTNRTTVAGREKGLIIFENFVFRRKWLVASACVYAP